MNMHNLYCLAPDMESTKSVISELKDLGISENNIYVVAKDHQAVQREHLHEAELDDTTDLYNAFKRGLMIGGGLGMLSGLVLALMIPENIISGYQAVILIALLGAALGAWVSAMIGVSVIQPNVEKYEQAIDEGSLLIMADVPEANELYVRRSIRDHHPEVLVEAVV